MSFQDIRRRSRKFLSAEEIRLLVFILIGVFLLLAMNIFLARVLPGGEWLYLRWSGARAFLVEQVDPYSTTIAERTQQVVYGRNAFSSEYSYVLNDPFYLVLLYTPLALFSDFAISRGVWMLFAEAALVASVFYAIRLSEWEPPRWLLVSLPTFGLLSYFSLQSLVSASSTIFLAFLYLAILLALRSFNDELAGALLVLTAYQWEVSGLYFLFVLIFVIANKRWGVLTGFGMSLFVMLIVSFLSFPGWGLPYFRAVLSGWYRGANLNIDSILSFWFPDSRFSLGAISAILLVVIVFIEWLGAVGSHFRRVVWAAALSLAATPLVGFAIFPSNHVVLILPLILILALVWERWNHWRVFASILVLGIAILIPFGLFVATLIVRERIYSDLLKVLPPVATIVGLYWMRWWVVRSPRTWLDQMEAR